MQPKEFVQVNVPAFGFDRTPGRDQDPDLLHSNYTGTRTEMDLQARQLGAAVIQSVKHHLQTRNEGQDKPICLGCFIPLFQNIIGMAMDEAGLKNHEASEIFDELSRHFKQEYLAVLQQGAELVSAGEHSIKESGLADFEWQSGEKARRKAFDGVEGYEYSDDMPSPLADILKRVTEGLEAKRNISRKVDGLGDLVEALLGKGRKYERHYGEHGASSIEEGSGPTVRKHTAEVDRLFNKSGGLWSQECVDYIEANGGKIELAPPIGQRGMISVSWPDPERQPA